MSIIQTVGQAAMKSTLEERKKRSEKFMMSFIGGWNNEREGGQSYGIKKVSIGFEH